MTTATDGTRLLTWKERYYLAICEVDNAKLPPLIDKASEAILDRMQETITAPALPNENQQLNDAMNGLRVLRREYELASQRKTG